MPRPQLTDASFLLHVFSPRKNEQPTGLRKTTLKGAKTHRKARVNAFNKMTSVKQEILKRSGQRDAYLRGEITFTDAKRHLRVEAVRKNLVRPVRNRRSNTVRPTRAIDLLERIADNIWRKTNMRPYTRRNAIDFNVKTYLDDPTEDMTVWSYDNIVQAAQGQEVDGRSYSVIVDGQTRNPFFYH